MECTSILATIANPIAVILIPVIGIHAWQMAAAAVTGFIAKENVVGTLAVCYGIFNLIDTEALEMAEGAGTEVAAVFGITKVAALAYLMFNLFTPPCFAAIGAMNAEIKQKKWLWGGIALQLGTGYTIGYLVYTVGTLLTDPAALNVQAAVGGLVAVAVMVGILLWLSARADKKVKGEYIQKEVLYNGNFLQILRETYRLPNENIIEKEKVVKNNGKDSVIVIAITQEKKYIITIQNRINDKLIAEFPSGYIENNEDPIEAAKRELKEETGYITDDLFLVDEAYTSSGIDNSKTYIVIANNCIKNDEKNVDSAEFVEYGLFSEKELEYLINNNIINGAMNKLAYYNLINNLDHCNVIFNNKKIYVRQKKKSNPLDN